ncbi:hypothetical protein [Patulibacter sp. SYSU D01012]|uniref:hypothetical protein n=1 Tax=Patulibacter sp. SYSU D01012 TaxID=2817381 RepID=UPI001B3143F4|nr:hypothetical protein [Patulibacter sp. SYSU D01012]
MRAPTLAPGLAGLLAATALLVTVPATAGAAGPAPVSPVPATSGPAVPGDRAGDGLPDLGDPPDAAPAPPTVDATAPTASIVLGRRSSSAPPRSITVRMADPETRLWLAAVDVRRTVRVRGRARTETFDGRRWRGGHPRTIDRSRTVRGRARATIRVPLTGLRPGAYVVRAAVANGARAMSTRVARFRVR